MRTAPQRSGDRAVEAGANHRVSLVNRTREPLGSGLELAARKVEACRADRNTVALTRTKRTHDGMSALLRLFSSPGPPVPLPSPNTPLIAANDNRRAAGERSGNALRLQLVVDTGHWQPEGPDGRTLVVHAFDKSDGS